MRKSPRSRLNDILRAIDRAAETIAGRDIGDYHRVYAIECTVQRSIEVVSEASRGIPAELKALHADIPWSQIAGIGNVLRHDYGIVDPHVLWNIVTDHYPRLRRAVVDLLDRLPAED